MEVETSTKGLSRPKAAAAAATKCTAATKTKSAT